MSKLGHVLQARRYMRNAREFYALGSRHTALALLKLARLELAIASVVQERADARAKLLLEGATP